MVFLLMACFTFYQSCKPARSCMIIAKTSASFLDKNIQQVIIDSSEVNANDLEIIYTIESKNFNCKKNKPFSFFNTAYATSIPIDYYLFDTIKSINIISNHDYDAQHPSGTSLNDIFNMPTIDSMNYYGDFYMPQYTFTLKKSPETEVFHQFKIITTLQSSDLPLVDSSRIFKLKI
jgi:hypothetical protein